MSQFQLFDSIKLKEALALDAGEIAPEGSLGAIVEVFNHGEAYMVELFGGWVKAAGGDFVPADHNEAQAFMETIGIGTVYPHQIHLVEPASTTVDIRAELLALVDELPEATLAQVKDFAEFLKAKHNVVNTPS